MTTETHEEEADRKLGRGRRGEGRGAQRGTQQRRRLRRRRHECQGEGGKAPGSGQRRRLRDLMSDILERLGRLEKPKDEAPTEGTPQS